MSGKKILRAQPPPVLIYARILPGIGIVFCARCDVVFFICRAETYVMLDNYVALYLSSWLFVLENLSTLKRLHPDLKMNHE